MGMGMGNGTLMWANEGFPLQPIPNGAHHGFFPAAAPILLTVVVEEEPGTRRQSPSSSFSISITNITDIIESDRSVDATHHIRKQEETITRRC